MSVKIKPLILLYKYYVNNEQVCRMIQAAIGESDKLLTLVKKWIFKWFCNALVSSGSTRTMLQGIVEETKTRGRQKKRLEDVVRSTKAA